MANKVMVSIDWEDVEELIRKNLMEDIENMKDIDHDKKMIKHLRKVLRFYSTVEQWEEYQNEHE